MKIPAICFLIFVPLLSLCTKKQNESSLEEGLSKKEFKNPSVENRPLAFWDWLNGYVDTTKLVYELEEMKDKGMQGAFIWDVGALMDPEEKIPVGPRFLDQESLGYISFAIRKGGELGLNLGMIASSSWNAGGTWIDDPDGAKELLSSTQQVTGPGRHVIQITAPASRRGIPEIYTLLKTVAVPHSASKTIDYASGEVTILNDPNKDDMIVEWEVPDGKWDVISFFMCNTGQHLACPSPNSDGLMIDHLSKKATRIHFDTIIDRLAQVSTDESQLKFLEVDSYEVWPAEDWTPSLISTFESRYGYDPVPYLPLLQSYETKDHDLGRRFRGDYKRLVSDLMIENHFAQARAMANENNMLLFAEAGHGGFPRVDPLKAFGYVDVPMGEFWNRQRHWVTKEAASGAHIYGKKLVASESLTGWNHWQHGPTDFKQLCDLAFIEGLNQVFFHTFAHNPEILGKPGAAYHAGEHINVNTTWWEMARPFMDYLSRCSYMLRQGNFVGDVLLYYGDDAPNLVPPKRIDPNYTPDMPGLFPDWFDDDSKCPHCGRPKPINPGDLSGYDYDYINADIITHALLAKNNTLVLPSGASYRVMLLPERPDMSLEVLKSLEKLVNNGAVIIGRKPERTTSLKNYPDGDAELKAIADQLWGGCDGRNILSNKYGKGTVYWGKTVKEVLKELNIPPDFEVRGIDNSDDQIDHIHRKTEIEDIYFISNSSEEEQEITCVFRVDKNRIPELWDAETGLVQRDVDFKKVDNGIGIDFIMDPLASRFVVFRGSSTGQNDVDLSYDLQFGFSKNQKTKKAIKSIDLTDNWEITFDPDMGAPKSHSLVKLISWTDVDHEGIQYYSGEATYSREFTLPKGSLSEDSEAFVVFENIQEMARVHINGNDCGIVWTPPYKARITPYLKQSINSITVEVINTWNNRIVGDIRNPEQEPFTNTNAKVKFSESSPLLSSGLIGKVTINFYQ